MSFLQAALEVLRREGKPLTTGEIMAYILAEDLIHTSGRTPTSTLSAALYRETSLHPHGPLRRLAVAGETRAVRGSVRWLLCP